MLVQLPRFAGFVREWDAKSGYHHNQSVTSQQRFDPEPFAPEVGVHGRYGPDAAGRWYYWKLKSSDVTPMSRFVPWFGYTCHQLTMWAVIYFRQAQKVSELRPT